ncbi:MAG TPA: hypothetical protein VFG00_11390 [Acidothermaceae bacterium]|nr:hypothetical protein [Acidothermaceae bacterium]
MLRADGVMRNPGKSLIVCLAGAVLLALLVTAVAAASAAGGGRLVWSRPVGGFTEPGKCLGIAATCEAGGLGTVSCPSTTLCVASGTGGSLATTDPTGREAAWTAMLYIGLIGVSCPSTSFCVGITPGNGTAGGTDHIYTTTDPAGGANAWHEFAIPHARGQFWAGISCGSASLCVAYESGRFKNGFHVSTGGYVAVSTDPAGGAAAWKLTSLHDVPAGVDCQGHTCVLGTNDGQVLTSGDPTSGRWRTTNVTGPHDGQLSDLGVLACTSSSYCLIGADGTPAVWYARDPASTKHWTPLRSIIALEGRGVLGGAGCGSTGRCVLAIDELTRASNTAALISSPKPGARWQAAHVKGQYFAASCPSETMCVAAGGNNYNGRFARVTVGRAAS